MRRILTIATLALGLAGTALASDFDGSKPLLCAATVSHDCGTYGPCVDGPPRAVGAPEFFRVDVAGKRITVVGGSDGERTSEINNVHQRDGRLALQGYENGYAWAMEIMGDDGGMVVTGAGDGVGFVIHGSCIVP